MKRRILRTATLIFACFATPAIAAGPPRVALDTTMGRIVVELDPDHAPVASRNFLRYAAEGHYDGTLVHRVVENFVVQGGGLTADMKERPTRSAIVNEAKSPAAGGLSNAAGTIAMAREDAPDSATSQWFVNVVDNPRLDHVDVPAAGVTVTRGGRETFVPASEANRVFGYAVFGHVVAGMDVVERMRHVAVRTVEVDGETYENVPVEAIVVTKATVLSGP